MPTAASLTAVCELQRSVYTTTIVSAVALFRLLLDDNFLGHSAVSLYTFFVNCSFRRFPSRLLFIAAMVLVLCVAGNARASVGAANLKAAATSSATGDADALDISALGSRGSINLSPAIMFLREPALEGAERLSVQTVLAKDSGWEKLNSPFLNKGFMQDVFWLKATLRNPGDIPVTGLLDIGYGLLDKVTLTVINLATGAISEFEAGDKRPFSQRPVAYPNFAFPLAFEADSRYQIVLRVETTSSMQVPLVLWDTIHFAEVRYEQAIFFGLLIGMILIMAFYNLFLFLALKDRSYLYFAACLAGYVLVEMILSSVAFAYLWPDQVLWNDKALVVSANLALAGLARFSVNFLNLRENLESFRRLLDSETALCLALAGLAFVFPYQNMIMITAVNVVLVPITGYLAGLYLSRRSYVTARYYSLAFTFFVVSAMVFVLNKFGLLPRNVITEYSIHAGAVSVVALLSFALADQVNREKLDKESAQQNAIENLEKYRLIYENSLEGMFRLDLQGHILAVNPSFARTMGVSNEAQLLTRTSNLSNLVPADEQTRLSIEHDLKLHGHLFGYEARCRRLDGQEFWAALFARVLQDPDTGERIIEGSLVDITEKKESEEQLHFLARHDPLTELLNRSEMERRLKRALQQAHEGKAQHVFLFLDLDQFKVVNDTCGHRAGDELLRQLAAVFQRHLRSRDALARLGGDEFGILFEHCLLENAVVIADALRQDVAEYRFAWNEKVFRVGASIGLVPICADSKSIDEVLSQADIACYTAKDGGRNQVVVHSEGRGDLSKRQSDMELVTIIKDAIQNDMLSLYFQRIFPLGNDSRPGERFEILVRLMHEGTCLLPGSFLPAAERYNIIAALDCWVVEHCLKWLKLHPERLDSIAQVNINLSGQTISNGESMARILAFLEEFSLPPDRLCFEITEHASITNMTGTTHFVKTLRGKGVRFSLDDFGSGFSSYSHLKHLPVTSLKIDGSFVRDINTDPFDLAMVKSITDIAHTMGLAVVAEFVEDQAILDTLKTLGIDYVQGFHLHEPEALL